MKKVRDATVQNVLFLPIDTLYAIMIYAVVVSLYICHTCELSQERA